MPPSSKPHIRAIKPVLHGGLGFTGYGSPGTTYPEILDFSTCCNPYGPPRNVYAALHKCDAQHYPDPESSGFIRLLSEKLMIPPAGLVAGSGSTELIRLAANAYFGPGDTVVIPSPTYGEYELASAIVNARVEKYAIDEADDFKLDCDDFISFAKLRRPAGIFLCNPNNPTGQYLDSNEVNKILDALPDTLVILDEAYIAFTADAWSSQSLLTKNNLFIIRSMTKDFALAGLRLGYGIASKAIIENIKKVRPPWNISSAAQSAGIAALSCGCYLSSCTDRIERSRAYLTRKLSSLGYRIVPTRTNFFIFETGDAGRFQKQLLDKGILVRNCASFGLPNYVRVAPLEITRCRKLVRAIEELQAEVR